MTVVLAMLLDAALGEPKWLWSRVSHPTVLMGRAIAYCDETYNVGTTKRRNGVLSLFGLITIAWIIGVAITALPGTLADILVGFILIAHRSLLDHVRAVADGLKQGLPQGRAAVGMIVSRDTTAMNESAVARSAIESGAENLSDGVIAPVFWFLLLGLPGLLAYKMANTADSMIGYKNERYADFGWAAARFDDLLNWIPARLTALMIWATDRRVALHTLQEDARKHRSPNAGWPEAAMAHKHDIALAGPRSYDGAMTSFPYVNASGRKALTHKDITQTIRTLWQVWGLMLAAAVLFGMLPL